jgi:nucleoside-diphosphate-sugar epimerase
MRVLGWTPSTTLEDGLTHTYRWIRSELETKQAVVRTA